jgi:hypothetical protein
MMLVKKALYRLNKSSGAAFRSHLVATTLDAMGFKLNSYADPDVWMQPAVKPDGFEYYEYYILCYVDDVLCIHHMTQQN